MILYNSLSLDVMFDVLTKLKVLMKKEMTAYEGVIETGLQLAIQLTELQWM